MSVLTEPKWNGEFIATEANGRRSRDNGILATGQAAILYPGRILGKVTTSGKFSDLVPGAADGTQTAAGILFGTTDATAADKACVVITRSCEVNQGELDYGTLTSGQKTTAIGQLVALGIIVRAAV
jgi:hypothetical protein